MCDRWLESHPDSAALLLSRARLSAQARQWRHAEEQALRAMERGAGEEAWELLGDIRRAQGDEDGAAHAYANALRAARGETPVPLPRERVVALQPDDPGIA